MSNLVAIRKPNDLAAEYGWTEAQANAIVTTIARGATPEELQIFLYRCKNLELDPFKPGQIFFIKYGNNPGATVVGIEGFRAKASRTGKLAGVSREVIKDEKGVLIGARCTVHRHDWKHPTVEEVSLSEYDTGRGVWKEKPEAMIKKVAEATALRVTFPDDLGGIYTDGELDKSHSKPWSGSPEQPPAGDGIQEDGVEIPYGKLAKKLVHKCDPAALRDYVQQIEEKAERLKKPIPAWAVPVIQAAEPIIARFEYEESARLRGVAVEEDLPFDGE
jgi:phage recombination protein Bet